MKNKPFVYDLISKQSLVISQLHQTSEINEKLIKTILGDLKKIESDDSDPQAVLYLAESFEKIMIKKEQLEFTKSLFVESIVH
jgi:hypothetical protein